MGGGPCSACSVIMFLGHGHPTSNLHPAFPGLSSNSSLFDLPFRLPWCSSWIYSIFGLTAPFHLLAIHPWLFTQRLYPSAHLSCIKSDAVYLSALFCFHADFFSTIFFLFRFLYALSFVIIVVGTLPRLCSFFSFIPSRSIPILTRMHCPACTAFH